MLRWACGEVAEQNVDGISMGRAVRLIEYFQSHARKVYAVMDLDPVIAKARYVLRWILTHPDDDRFNRRRLHQALKNHNWFQRPDDFDAPLKVLKEHGYVRSLVDHGPSARQEYEFNPLARHPQHAQGAHDQVA
jgi:hypothetical protein